MDHVAVYNSLCKTHCPESAIRRAVVRAFNLCKFCPDEDFLERTCETFVRNISKWNCKTDGIFFDSVELGKTGMNHDIVGNLIQGQLKIDFAIIDINGMSLLHFWRPLSMLMGWK